MRDERCYGRRIAAGHLAVAGDRLVAWLAPARGGHLYELDIRSIRHNLVATLDRRPEPYHEVVKSAGQHQGNGHDDQIVPLNISAKRAAKLVRGAREVYYPGAAHGITTTLRDEINAELLAFATAGSPQVVVAGV